MVMRRCLPVGGEPGGAGGGASEADTSVHPYISRGEKKGGSGSGMSASQPPFNEETRGDQTETSRARNREIEVADPAIAISAISAIRSTGDRRLTYRQAPWRVADSRWLLAVAESFLLKFSFRCPEDSLIALRNGVNPQCGADVNARAVRGLMIA
jgi:hypothetical protein